MKLKNIIILIITFIIMPLNVFANDNGNISVSCNKNIIVPNGTLYCNIEGKTTGKVSSVSAKIVLGDNLELVSVDTDSSWEGNGDDGNIDLYTDENKSGIFPIATFVVKAKNITEGFDTSINIKNVEYSDELFEIYNPTNASTNVRIASSINTLTHLMVDDIIVDLYKELAVTIDKESISIRATATSNKATVSGDVGKQTLKYGINTFKIEVLSEAGTKKTYSLNINRPDNRSADNSLKELSVSNTEIKLEGNLLEYKLSVENDSIEIKAITNDSKATITGDIGKQTLKYGINTFKINVTSESEHEKTYVLKITRIDNRNTDNNLKELLVIGNDTNFGSKEFRENVTEYELIVYDENVEIKATANNDKAKVSGDVGVVQLNYGTNTFEIKVTSESEIEKIYLIKINRVKKEEVDDEKEEIIIPNNGEEETDGALKDNPVTGIGISLIVIMIIIVIGISSYYIYNKIKNKNKIYNI